MKPPFYFAMLFCILATQGCKRHCPDAAPYVDPDRRSQFVGRYKVIDANPQFYYEISKIDSNKQSWIKIKNFANLFDMQYRFEEYTSSPNELNFESYFPIVDKHGNRWDFGVYDNPSVPDNCLLHNDTLRVYFRIQNAPWYVDDDTTGINKYYLQTGVKQH